MLTGSRVVLHAWRHPSGVSSVAALARTVADPHVQEVTSRRESADEMLRPVQRGPQGGRRGTVCVTEISVGRFLAGTNLLDVSGKHNMAVT